MTRFRLAAWYMLMIWNSTIFCMKTEYCAQVTLQLKKVLESWYCDITWNPACRNNLKAPIFLATYSNPSITTEADHYWKNQQRIIVKAVSSHADPETTDSWGHTCLSLALTYDDLDTAEHVLKHGANPNARDSIVLPLPIIYYVKRLDIAQLLVKYGLQLTALKDLLHTTLSSQYAPDLIPLYITQGADPAAQDDKGNTPLHTLILLIQDRYALFKPSSEDAIKKAGYLLNAKPALLHIQNKGGYTPRDLLAYSDRHALLDFFDQYRQKLEQKTN